MYEKGCSVKNVNKKYYYYNKLKELLQDFNEVVEREIKQHSNIVVLVVYMKTIVCFIKDLLKMLCKRPLEWNTVLGKLKNDFENCQKN